MTRIENQERRRKTSVVSLLVAVVGVWVGLSIFLTDVAAATLWNNVVVGTAVFLAGGYNYYRLTTDVPISRSLTMLVGLLGAWLGIAPALLEMTAWPFWSTLASGLLIAGLAGYNAYDARKAQSTAADSGSETV